MVGAEFLICALCVTPTLHSELWETIRRFSLDDPAAAFSFTDRLARENGWPLDLALRAVEEYKRFMFLLCVTDEPLTPSDEVDQVWHLHLLYTRSYWIDFCQHTLARPIHHGPARGGAQEQDKFTDWYGRTLTQYAAVFGAPPPPTSGLLPPCAFGAPGFSASIFLLTGCCPDFRCYGAPRSNGLPPRSPPHRIAAAAGRHHPAAAATITPDVSGTAAPGGAGAGKPPGAASPPRPGYVGELCEASPAQPFSTTSPAPTKPCCCVRFCSSVCRKCCCGTMCGWLSKRPR